MTWLAGQAWVRPQVLGDGVAWSVEQHHIGVPRLRYLNRNLACLR
jgi:hypothetical protein